LGAEKRRCLTYGELFLTTAIVAVLASLLLPVFARARDQAREAVCLADIRTVAQALRMYLTEADGRLPPAEYDPEVLAYFSTYPGGAGADQWDPARPGAEPVCHRARRANPYLRWPVVLETYLPDREVWRCPNARLAGGAFFINGAADWLAHLQAQEGQWGLHTDPWVCPAPSWPKGWGGEVSDSLTQRRIALPVTGKGKVASAGMFLQSIGVNEGSAAGMNVSEVADPAWYVLCADAGATVESFTTGTLAYPDVCHLGCAGPGDWEAHWGNCPWSRECGAVAAMKTGPELRRPYARHFGGVNIGFLDGHAKWFDSETVIAESPSTGNPNRGRLRGYEPGSATSDAWDPNSGIPPLY
jgi:prepilin-type processing-associated H-X9-DG protein